LRKEASGMQRIIDTTLREGEQTPGVSFSGEIKRQIVTGLCAIGVDEIEIGVASVGYPLCAHLL